MFLEEGELLGLWFVEELDGADIAVTGGNDQFFGHGAKLLVLLRGQDGRGRLFEDLLVPALDAAVAHTKRPRSALTVARYLHLDMTGTGYEVLHEHGGVTEGFARFVTGPVEGRLYLAVVFDEADPPTAAARSRLDQKWEADIGRMTASVFDGVDAARAPWRNRHTDLLGKVFGPDLVAQLAHDVGRRPDERDA